MTVHHIIREKDQKNVCTYCGNSLISMDWDSAFEGDSLYKVLHCTCGRKVVVKMPFMGSGHDSWSKTTNLDKKIEEVDSESQKE